jgi:hypothetical protein
MILLPFYEAVCSLRLGECCQKIDGNCFLLTHFKGVPSFTEVRLHSFIKNLLFQGERMN